MAEYQEIITLIIVGIAASIAGYKLYVKFTNPTKSCDSCASSSNCGGCQLQDLKKEIEENKRKKEAANQHYPAG